MYKPLFAVAAAGLATVLLLPLLGAVLGFVLTILKFVALGGLIWFVFWLLTRKKDKGGEAPAA